MGADPDEFDEQSTVLNEKFDPSPTPLSFVILFVASFFVERKKGITQATSPNPFFGGST